jgi:lambda family phage tail tape measure protein
MPWVVYDSPSLSAYSNGVYSTPKTFAFAKGAGIFGEAGPEAIMPLTRAADGSLGFVLSIQV